MNLNDYLVDFLRSKPLRHGVAALLAVCAGFIVWSMLPHATKATHIAANPVTQPVRASLGFAVEKIATAHLFGQSDVSISDAAPVATVATINVQGLFYSVDKDEARAILEINGKSDVFKTGDALPDGETLAAIGMNAVQIANGPSLRVVELEKGFGAASSGIMLDGGLDLYAQQDPFPGMKPSGNTVAPVVQRLRTVTIPQGGDPISQMQALRQQLIKH